MVKKESIESEKENDGMIALSWLNSGNPFEVPKMTVGIQRRILEFQEQHADVYAKANRADAEGKLLDPETDLKLQKLNFDLQLEIIYHTLRRKFPEIKKEDIEENMTLDEVMKLSGIILSSMSETMKEASKKVPLLPQSSVSRSKSS